MTQPRRATWAAISLAFAVTAVAMTWPMWRAPGTLAPQHQDVYFNMWRLRWFAHAMRTSPLHLFDANIFHPEKDTLAYSDAMLLEGLVAAPFSALNPVLVHFTEQVHQDGTMTFDYQLREGLATSTNALRLMQLIGIKPR